MIKKVVESFVQEKSKGKDISSVEQRIIINQILTKIKFSGDDNLDELFIEALLGIKK